MLKSLIHYVSVNLITILDIVELILKILVRIAPMTAWEWDDKAIPWIAEKFDDLKLWLVNQGRA